MQKLTKNKIQKNKELASPKQSKGGFVMLFAVVLSSIILAVTLGVANIALKELNFTTSAKATNDAFFAADAGTECALYYDIVGAQSSSGIVNPFGVPSPNVNTYCAGVGVDLNNGSSTPNPTGPWTFYLHSIGVNKKSCAIVTVTKTTSPSTTSIVSKGYDVGGDNPTCVYTSTNRVERQIEINY